MEKLDQIQITTTEETAQTAGYALMGARNMLTARASAENICGEFRDNLRKEIAILSHIIASFARADIIEPLGKDAKPLTPAEVKAKLDRKAGLPVGTIVRGKPGLEPFKPGSPIRFGGKS